MRSKAPLVLMEQMVMLLVFALAAALCLQAFVRSDSASRHSEARDRAAVLCQSVAESVHSSGGLDAAAQQLGFQFSQDLLWMDYDEDWNSASNGTYLLTAQGLPSDTPGLNLARVAVDQDGEVLFELEIAWQGEVGSGG